MFTKVLILLSVCALVVLSKEHGHSSQYIHKHDDHHVLVTVKEHNHHEHHYDYYTPPKYEFKYQIKNPHTGDHKGQHEHRHEDSVKGEYFLHEPDGGARHIHYHADKKTGFHADVKHSVHHLVPEKHHR